MKSLALCFLLSATCYSQTLQNKIQGTWVCTNLRDSIGNKAVGEFGRSANYLKFNFEDDKLFVALAPFDVGIPVKLIFGADYFELVDSPFTQKRYSVVTYSGHDLVLRTVNAKGVPIDYYFVNQSTYTSDLNQLSNYRDFGKIILNITYWSQSGLYQINSYYLIDNTVLNRVPSPLFGNKKYTSVGKYFDLNFRLPNPHNPAIFPGEFVVDFEVTTAGIENIALVRQLGPEYDIHLIDLLRGMNKTWRPLVVNGKVIDTRMHWVISFKYETR